MIRISFIGAGRVFDHYLKILKKINQKKYEIVSVCDINKKNLSKISKKIKFYNNFDHMIKIEKIDLLIVLTPSGLHYDHVSKGLKNNINVLVEKPITLKINEAKKLINLSKKNKLYFGVMFQNRYNKSIQFLKKAIDQNKLKKIICSNVNLIWSRYQSYYQDDWHGKWKMDGGVLSQQLIHHVDAMRYLLGDIKKVCAFSSNVINKLEAEDTISSLVIYKKGFTGTINGTTAYRPNDIEASLKIIASNAYIEIGGIALNKIINFNINGKGISTKTKKMNSERVLSGYGNSHKVCLDYIFKHLKRKKFYKEKFLDPNQALETLKIVSSLYRSSEDGNVINLGKNTYSQKLGL